MTGNALTNYSTTVNTTYFEGEAGGIILNGTQGAQTIFNWKNAGGIVLGGTQPVRQVITLSTPLTISEEDANVSFISTPLTIASAFSLPVFFDIVNTKMLISSKFVPVTPRILASNRCDTLTSR